MNDDMSSLMDNLKGMLENGNIPPEIKNIMDNISSENTNTSNNSNNTNTQDTSSSGSIDPNMIANLMNMFNNSNASTNQNNENSEKSSTPSIDIETMMKMKTIIEKMNTTNKDPRSNLLLSLKPYLKNSRKDKVEQYVKFLNMANVLDVLNPNGGDKAK